MLSLTFSAKALLPSLLFPKQAGMFLPQGLVTYCPFSLKPPPLRHPLSFPLSPSGLVQILSPQWDRLRLFKTENFPHSHPHSKFHFPSFLSIAFSLLLSHLPGYPGGTVVKLHWLCLLMQETQEMQVQFLAQEDPLENGTATHCSTLAWRIPQTEEPGGLQSMKSQRVRHDWAHIQAHTT